MYYMFAAAPCKIPVLEHAYVNLSTPESRLEHGRLLNVSCQENYELAYNATPPRCNNGSWTHLPICAPGEPIPTCAPEPRRFKITLDKEPLRAYMRITKDQNTRLFETVQVRFRPSRFPGACAPGFRWPELTSP